LAASDKVEYVEVMLIEDNATSVPMTMIARPVARPDARTVLSRRASRLVRRGAVAGFGGAAACRAPGFASAGGSDGRSTAYLVDTMLITDLPASPASGVTIPPARTGWLLSLPTCAHRASPASAEGPA
jgi:hypothetical protein